MIKIRRGLDLPIVGEPEQVVVETKTPQTVALLGGDYIGMKPAMEIRVADFVDAGQVLFTDRRVPDVKYTSPGSGRIAAIHRGNKRALLSVVIQLSGTGAVTFPSFPESRLNGLNKEEILEPLIDSGLWAAIRTRPYSMVADPRTEPHSIFVPAMDTNPLAPRIDKILEGQQAQFGNGLRIISKLTKGKVYLCRETGAPVPEPDLPNLVVEEFSGPHPAGNVGTHIHFLDPVHRHKMVWHIGVQDVIAAGKLFTTGTLQTDRIVSLAGPSVRRPRLIKTRLGASLPEITSGEIKDGNHRIVSGSVLSGRAASGEVAFLGRYHQQISVLSENTSRRFLGWLDPGWNLFSVKNVVLSNLLPGRKLRLTTSTNGEVRAIVPSGNYERVMPLDIVPLFLMRALAVDDVEEAESLGALELDEEDLALSALVCPSKLEFGPLLRRNLRTMREEG